MTPFQDFLLYLQTTHRQVAQVYRFGSRVGSTVVVAASRSFTAERLAAGATMLRDMIYTAWLESAQTAPDRQNTQEHPAAIISRALCILPT